MNSVKCDSCGTFFDTDEHSLRFIKQDGLTVQYFACPFCGARYHVFTADSKMRELIGRRKSVQTQIKIARAKKFRKPIIKRFERELERIIGQQKKMMPKLKSAGEKILKEYQE